MQRRLDDTTIGRRTFLYGTASVAAAAVVGANTGVVHAVSGPTSATTQADGTDLGIPIRAVNVRAGKSGAVGERSVLYVFSNGAPGVFNVIDAETGERLAAHELTGYESSYAIAVAPDGTVYFEGRPRGELFRYFPEEDRLVDLGKVTAQAWTIPDIAIDDDGVVYGGTSQEGHLFTYDPAADEFTDHGVVAEGETFAYVGAVHDGVAYVGTRQGARFFEIDVRRGDKREIDLPAPYDSSETRAIPKGYRHGLVFLHVSTSHAMLIYDTRKRRWIEELPDHASEAEPTQRVRRKVYAEHRGTRRLWAYDPVRQRVETTDFDTNQLGGVTRAMGLASFGGADFPAMTVAGMGVTGRMWHWNPTTGASRWLDGDIQGGPVKIRAIGAGPDGNIYVGGFFTSGAVGRYLVAEDRMEQLDGPTQIEGFGVVDGKLYMGTYTGAGIVEFDPQQEWDFGTNPTTLFNLSDHGQDRPWALVGVGERLAIGTTAAGGSLDGALSFYTPATGELNIIGTLFEGHGVPSLAARDSLLAGGTSTRVSGTDPVADTPRLFLWDASADQLLWDGEPFDDATDIGEVMFDADGTLWGLTNNARLFEFDVDTRQVTRSVFIRPDSDANTGMPRLFAGPDGALYGTTGNNDQDLFRVDPQTLDVEILDTESAFACLGTDGNIYYAKNDSSLYRWSL